MGSNETEEIDCENIKLIEKSLSNSRPQKYWNFTPKDTLKTDADGIELASSEAKILNLTFLSASHPSPGLVLQIVNEQDLIYSK